MASAVSSQRSPPSGSQLSPSPDALHASMEPLQLQGGWLRRLEEGEADATDSSASSSSSRHVYARLTLGLSPSHPGVLSCFDGEASNSARLLNVTIDSSIALSSDPLRRQIALHSRPQPLSPDGAVTSADAAPPTAVHCTFQASSERDFRAWEAAFEQVATQTRSWEEEARRTKERERVRRLAAAAASHPPPPAPVRSAKSTAQPPTPTRSQQAGSQPPMTSTSSSSASIDVVSPSQSVSSGVELAVEMQSWPLGSKSSSRTVRTVSDAASELGVSGAGTPGSARRSVPDSRSGSNADVAGFNPDAYHPISAVSPQISAHPSPAWQRRSMPTLPLTPSAAAAPDTAAADDDETEEASDVRGANHTDAPMPSVASLLAEAENAAETTANASASPGLVDVDLFPSTPSAGGRSASDAPLSLWDGGDNGAGSGSSNNTNSSSNVCTPVSRSGTVLRALQSASAKLPAAALDSSGARIEPPVQPSLDSPLSISGGRGDAPLDSAGSSASAQNDAGANAGVAMSATATLSTLVPEASSPRSGKEGPISPSSRERKQRQGDYAGFGSGGLVGSGSGSGSGNADYSGISHVVTSSTRNANSTVPLSPTSVLRSASPAVPPSHPHGHGHGHGHGQAHALRSSMSADFTGGGVGGGLGVGGGANLGVSSGASNRSAYEIAAAAAAAASASAAAAKESARVKALEKEAARVKALEKKAADAKALREMKSRMFSKLFSLPESESLIEDYSAAIRKSILLHGRLYISWSHVCFFSSIFSHKTSLVVAMDDVLWVSAASVALLFDNSIKVYVQTGPLPVPKINAQGHVVPLPGATIVVPAALPAAVAAAAAEPRSTPGASSPAQQGASFSPSLSSSVPTRADLPQLLEEAAAEAAGQAAQPSPSSATDSTAPPTLSLSTSASSSDGASTTGPPSPSSSSSSSLSATTASTIIPAIVAAGTGESYGDTISTTTRASIDLNEQQLAYLIAIGHTNIATHFFASFLMRDHCLALIEGIMRKRRELHPHWRSMDKAWKDIDERRAVEQARRAEEAAKIAQQQAEAAELAAAAAAAIDAADAEISANSHSSSTNRDPPLSSRVYEQPSPSMRSRSSAASIDSYTGGADDASTAASTGATRSSSVSSVASTVGTGLSSAASSPRHGRYSPLSDVGEQKSSAPPAATAAASATSDASLLPADSSIPVVPRLDFGDAPIPEDDFQRMEWEELVDRPLGAGLNARQFFALFLSDRALWTTMQYAMAAGRGDDKWRLSSWHRLGDNRPVLTDAASDLAGPWVRDSAYIKLMKDSPVGPPSTRVHQHSVYRLSGGTVKIETRSLTPDVPFGDNLYVLERLEIQDEPAPAGSGGAPRCRIKVHVGVRFIRTPWKMKMFVTLIKSRTKEDVGKWYQQWIDSIESFVKRNPELVQAAVQREIAAAGGDAVGAQATISQRAIGGDDMAAPGRVGANGASGMAAPDSASASSSSAAGLATEGTGTAPAASDPAHVCHPSPSSAQSSSLSSGPSKPLVQRLREGGGAVLRRMPVLGAHTDTLLTSVSDARTRLSSLSLLELLGVGLVLAAFEALLVQGRHGADALFSLLLPWRWIGAFLSASPAVLLCGALLCLLLHQRQQLTDVTGQLQRTEQQHAQLHRNVQEQLSSIMHLVQQMTTHHTTRIDEQHFR